MFDQSQTNLNAGGTPLDEAIYVLIPVFNDWPALEALLPLLDRALSAASRRVSVLVIDDGSTVPRGPTLSHATYRAIERIQILELRRNLGHQRAIAIGLAYVEARVPASAVVIMDGDGEDAPEDVPRLLERYEREHRCRIVFAERRRRSESRAFKVSYALYRAAHVVLTGHRVRVGNFSVVPRALLQRLVVVSELWSHYAAAVFKARLPFVTVPTARARRLVGESSMNYVGLVVHGLSAISVYSDIIGVRALVASLALIVLSGAGIATVATIRFFTGLAIPGWATVSTGVLLIVLLQAVLFSLVFSFTTLANRHGFSFLPARDYHYFVGRLVDVRTQTV